MSNNNTPLIDSYEKFVEFNNLLANTKYTRKVKILRVTSTNQMIIKEGTNSKEVVSISDYLYEFVNKQTQYIERVERLSSYDFSKLYSKTHPEEYMKNLHTYAQNLLTVGEKRFNLWDFVVEITDITPISLGLEIIAYTGNKDIMNIEIPYGVTSIGEGVFREYRTIYSVKFPRTLKRIGESSFYSTSLMSLEIPDTVEVIDKHAFAFNDNLRTLKLSKGLKTIGKSAFYKSYHLEEVVIPDTVEEIGESAFQDCHRLNKIALPKNLKYLGPSAFNSTLIDEVVIPDNLVKIEFSTFAYCRRLKSIVLPKNLKEIGTQSFSKVGIEEIDIPSGVEIIGHEAFEGCKHLRRAKIPSTIVRFDIEAFKNTPLEKLVNEKTKLEENQILCKEIDIEAFKNTPDSEMVVTFNKIRDNILNGIRGVTLEA